MKKSIIKVFSVILVVVLTLTSAPLSCFVGIELPKWLDFSINASATTSGTCGENLIWTFDESTGTLTISGTGVMDDYKYDSNSYSYKRPWEKYKDKIRCVTITNEVTSIGENAFNGCLHMISVKFSNSVIKIGKRAFMNCRILTDVKFPNSLSIIGEEAFKYCDHIINITIPENVTLIEGSAFSNCISLSFVTASSCVFETGFQSVFNECENIEEIIVNDDVLSLNYYAFYGYNKLKTVILGNSLATISWGAFEACESLTTVIIPKSVTRISDNAFVYLPKSIVIYYEGTEEDWSKISISKNNYSLSKAKFYYNSLGNIFNTIEFGSYPQSQVTDDNLVSILNSLPKEWISYEYYSGTGSWGDGQMSPSDYMKFADVKFNDAKYRAVFFTQYRPDTTGYICSAENSYQDENNFYINTVYWFKYEPLRWSVLDSDKGLVVCENIVDSQAYNNMIYYIDNTAFQNSRCENYANDYTTSSIREWLNTEFYETAFNDIEKLHIQESFQFNNVMTNDKIFLLSNEQITNNELRFSSDASDCDRARRAQQTDYAKCQGLYSYNSTNNAFWWIGSPNGSSGAYYVSYCGTSNNVTNVNRTSKGIRPAMVLSYETINPECTHSYSSVVILPTCTDSGYTTYTCSVCGDTYTSDFVDALGHTDGETVEENYVAPTCTETGSKDNVTYCTVCDAETSRKEIIIDATGHTEEEIPAVAPTCTENGLTAGVKCSVCGEILTAQQEILANGHKYESVVTAPTCTEQGYTTYTCACGDSYVDDYTDSLGHDFENGTCTECSATDPDYFTFEIQNPSRTTIRCNDGIKLHTSITGNLPEGSRIEWSKNNSNFNANVSDSGKEITIISKNNGYTTFTATVYDADNKVIAEDTIEMYSKASFFDKIGGFFRSLFGTTKIYEN
jgi:hypothetical protein